jgi:FKBP-type peptidyl-prolyl cis-trans isomerase
MKGLIKEVLSIQHIDTMVRRRKRSDSDNDESLEQRYSQAQRPGKAEDDAKSPEETTHKKESEKVNSETPSKTTQKDAKSSLSEQEQKKIERLRLRKKHRKEMKQSKAQVKEEQQKKSQATTSPKHKTDAASKTTDDTFVELQKGVHYRDVIVGKGPLVQARKKVRVAYVLRAKERYGKIIDKSNDFGFRVGRGEVIQAWDIGVSGMRQGGKRYLKVPPQAGYGQRDVGAGKGGLLFFEVTVLDC